MSVVVPSYRAEATLPACVQSLLAQRFPGRYEVIVVASADRPDELPVLPADPALTVVASTPRRAAAAARNAGARRARGAAIAFTDADVVAPPDWLARLAAAGAGGRCAAGAIANGTPASVPGTVEYLVEFFDLSPSRRRAAPHGATANLFVPRELWARYGPFPEDMGGCEDTLLTARLHADGRLVFEPSAYVVHMNRVRMRSVLTHQYELGACHARLEQRRGQPPSVVVAARATAGRVAHLYRSVDGWTPHRRARARRLAPLVLPTFAAWGAGFAREGARLRRAAYAS